MKISVLNLVVKFGIALSCFTTLHAHTLSVTTNADSGPGSLREALLSAQKGDLIDCSSISNQVIQLQSSLPPIVNDLIVNDTTTPVTIDANGYQAFFVFNGTVQINGFAIKNAVAQGSKGGSAVQQSPGSGGGGGLGAGGAVFVNLNADVTLDSIDFQSNQAIGGDGGDADLTSGSSDEYTTGSGGAGAFGGGAGGNSVANLNTGAGGGGGGYPGGGVGASGNYDIDGGQSGGAGTGVGGGGGSTGAYGYPPIAQGGAGGTLGGGGSGGEASYEYGGAGGGGGGYGVNGQPGDPTDKNLAAGGGSGGGGAVLGGAGGYLGGGGGGGGTRGGDIGGAGGFGAGGGGGGALGYGGSGGIGGGGGGGQYGDASAGKSVFGGGSGGDGSSSNQNEGGAGGGGAAFGGAIYVHSVNTFGTPGVLNLVNCTFDSAHTVTGGSGGTVQGTAKPGESGYGFGQEIFLANNVGLTIDIDSNQTIPHAIESLPPELTNIEGKIASITKKGKGALTLQGQPSESPASITGAFNLLEGEVIIDSNSVVKSNAVTVKETLVVNGILTGYQVENSTIPLNLVVMGDVSGTGQIGSVTIPAKIFADNPNGNLSFLDPKIVGSGGLLLNSGTLRLTNTNTYSGGTEIKGGTLSVSQSSNLGTGRVDFANFESSGTLNFYKSVNDFDLPINIDSRLGIISTDKGTSSTISSDIGGDGILGKSGLGTLILAGLNTYHGGTQIMDGTLSIGEVNQLGTGSVTFVDSGFLEFNQNISNFSLPIHVNSGVQGGINVLSNNCTVNSQLSGSGTFIKDGAGKLTLSNSNTNYVGDISIDDGTLAILKDTQLSGSITVDSSSTFDISQITPSTFNGNALSGTGTVQLGSKTLTLSPVASASFNGIIAGTGGLDKQGTGTQNLGGKNTYTGGTNISSGTLALAENGTIVGSINIESGAKFDISQITSSTFNGTGLLGEGTVQLGEKTLTLSPAASTSFNGIIAGTGRLDKQGKGTQNLGGENTYTGGTKVSGGTLALAKNGTVVGRIDIESGATFDISQITPSTFNGTGLLGEGTVQLGEKTLILNPTTSASFDGVIAGTGALDKQGAETQSLGGKNTYTGGTKISGGTLALAENGILVGDVNIESGATFDISQITLSTFNGNALGGTGTVQLGSKTLILNPTTSASFDGVIVGTGALDKQGAETQSLGGKNTYTGGTKISGGTLALAENGTLVGDVNIESGATFDISKITPSTFNGNTLDGTGTVQLGEKTLTLSPVASASFNGIIAGTGGLDKQGTGTQNLGGENTYTGGTKVSGGTLALAGNGTVMGRIDIDSGATFEISQITPSSFEGTGLLGEGTVQLGSKTLILSPRTSASFDGIITGKGGLDKQGTGTQNLGGKNTYTGGTKISGGTLALAENGTLVGDVNIESGAKFDISQLTPTSFNGNGLEGSGTVQLGSKILVLSPSTSTSFDGVIAGTGALKKEGGGTQKLGGKNTYTGGTEIAAGVLSIEAGSNLGMGAVEFNGTSTLLFGKAISDFSLPLSIAQQAIGTVDVGNNPSTISSAISGQGTFLKKGGGILSLSGTNSCKKTQIENGTLAVIQNGQLSGTLKINPGSNFDISAVTPVSFAIGGLNGSGSILLGSKSLQIQSSDNDQYNGSIKGSSGLGSVVKQGMGTLIFNGANTYGGGTTISEGTLSISADQQLGNSSGSLILNGGELNVSDTFISTRSVSLAANGGKVDVNSKKNLTLTGSMNGLGSFTKSGDGTLTIGNTQSNFTGPFYLNNGGIIVTEGESLGSTGETIFFSGGELEIEKSFTTDRSISLENGDGLITIDANVVFTLSGEISGSNKLIKQGTGGLVLNGHNSYTGDTEIKAGTLTGNTETIPTDVSNDGTLIFNQGSTGTFNRAITGSGAVLKEGAGTLVLSNQNSYTGGTTLQDGILSVSTSNQLGNGAVSFEAAATLQFAQSIADFNHTLSIAENQVGTVDVGSFNSSISSAITGAGALKKAGAGVLTLSGANHYGGGTFIDAGTLSIGSVSNLGTGTVTWSRTSVLQFTQALEQFSLPLVIPDSVVGTVDIENHDSTLTGEISGLGTLKKVGVGTLTLNHSNTYVGGTQLSGGTVSVGNVSALGTGMVTFDMSSNLQFTENITNFNLPISIAANQVGALDVKNNDVAIDSVISGSGALRKVGLGNLTLTQKNTYTGGTQLYGGTVSIEAENALGIGKVAFDASSSLQFTQNIAGFDLPLSIAPNQIGTLNVGSHDAVINSEISGSGVLRKAGSGTLTLPQKNTYSGGTQLSEGTVVIANKNALGTGKVTFEASSSLQFTQSLDSFALPLSIAANQVGTLDVKNNSVRIDSEISGKGGLKKVGAGSLILTHENTYTGGTSIQAGILVIQTPTNLGTQNVTFSGNSTLEMTQAIPDFNLRLVINQGKVGVIDIGSYDVSISSSIMGTGEFTKKGTGVLHLLQPSYYTGGTTVKNGTLQLEGAGTLSTNGSVTLNQEASFDLSLIDDNVLKIGPLRGLGAVQLGSKTLNVATEGSDQFDGIIEGDGGSFAKSGSGSLTLSGKSTYGHTTVVEKGQLTIGASGQLNPSANLRVDREGIFDITQFPGPDFSIGNLTGLGGEVQIGTNNLVTNTHLESIFTGVIEGSTGSLVKQGSGKLVLLGLNDYEGGIFIKEGTLAIGNNTVLGNGPIHLEGGELQVLRSCSIPNTIEFASDGTIEVDLGQTLTCQGALQGQHSLTKTGLGSILFEKGVTEYTGPVYVDAGTLRVNCQFPSKFQINHLATLAGQGFVGSVENNGYIKPGNSIGTMTVMGDYVQSNVGNLNIEINDKGEADLVSVTGAADLNGTINIIPLPGSYFSGRYEYTVLEAAGGITGQFSNVNIFDLGNDLKLYIQYLSQAVQLDTSLASNHFFFGKNIKGYNPLQVKHYLEKQKYFANMTPVPAQSDLISVIEQITPLSASDTSKALDQMHPAPFGAVGMLNGEIRSYLANWLTQPPSACCEEVNCCRGLNLWLQPFGSRINQQNRGEQIGFDVWTGGLAGGGSYCFENQLSVGLSLGFNTSYLKWREGRGNLHLLSPFLGLYANWTKSRWFLGGSIIGGLDHFNTERRLDFAEIRRNAKSKHHGFDLSAHIGGGMILVTSLFTAQPFVNLNFTSLYQSSFKETGAKSLNLKVEGKHFGWLKASEGLAFTRAFETHFGCFSPTFWVSLVTMVPLSSRNYTASLSGQTGHFNVKTYHRVSNRFAPGIDLLWNIGRNIQLSGSYSAEIGKDFSEQKGELQFNWIF